MTQAQLAFLRALAETEGWATYVDGNHWSLPDGRTARISRSEVEELQRLDYVGGGPRFYAHIIADGWWTAKITEPGKAALAREQKGDGI